ncbi:hypothetical protein BGZ60DRAFT_402011 [Tricladium varicosporioides]|nr:hypothetical protein BGZ60DRAFT_402011 [Hymenoscyphus varicosporioides]
MFHPKFVSRFLPSTPAMLAGPCIPHHQVVAKGVEHHVDSNFEDSCGKFKAQVHAVRQISAPFCLIFFHPVSTANLPSSEKDGGKRRVLVQMLPKSYSLIQFVSRALIVQHTCIL